MTMINPYGKSRCCLYWSAGREQSCLLTIGGLFIPLPDHIKLHCCTSNFTNCKHYLNKITYFHNNSLSNHNPSEESRRRYRRVKERLPIVIEQVDEDGQLVRMLDDRAVTSDLSLGGMRFECRHLFSAPHPIMFTLGRTQMGGTQTGKAEVRWVRRQPQSDIYEVGAVFSDEKTVKLIGNYISLPYTTRVTE